MMNILITGASGFIGAQIVTELMAAGHNITCCARNTSFLKNLFPNATIISCDFIKDTSAEAWIPRLKDIDIVVNCVGILYHPNQNITWAVHYDTPRALFAACVQAGIKKIIQISALGVDKSSVPYAKSKKAADDYLLTLPISAFILRPSLVYGARSYGGTSLFRGLASLPGIIPVPGKGNQEFQPIHIQDLAKSIVNLIEKPLDQSMILNAVGPEKITLKEVLIKLRAWLGFSKAKLLFVPLQFIKIGSLLGSLIPYSAMNMTSYKMLIKNNVATEEETKKFHQLIGFIPRSFPAGLYSQPSAVQDRWHARLYFLKPLLQLSIAFIWIFSAVCSIFFYPKTASYQLLAHIGITSFWQPLFLYGASAVDALLGAAMFRHSQIKKVCLLQILVIIIYSTIITWKLPHLWLEPFAPIAKNIPLIVATFIFLAMESDR
jgi:nucleoside-diphosphate-sugar epimerase